MDRSNLPLPLTSPTTLLDYKPTNKPGDKQFWYFYFNEGGEGGGLVGVGLGSKYKSTTGAP